MRESPRRGLNNRAWGKRSGVAAERRPRYTGSPTIKAPTGAQQELTRCVLRAIFVSCEIFIERMVFMRVQTRVMFCNAPVGAWELFRRLPRAARCRRGRRHRSAPGSIVSARWAGRMTPSHMAIWRNRISGASLSFHRSRARFLPSHATSRGCTGHKPGLDRFDHVRGVLLKDP